jgi:predicted nucleotidyltransferase
VIDANLRPIPYELLRTFLNTHARGQRLLQVALVGAHGCGFGSDNAPYELKGIFVEPTANLVGLHEPPRTVNWVGELQGLRIDYSAHEIGHGLRALLRGDGSVLERILAPEQLLPQPALAQLQAIARGTISQRFYAHYRSYGRGLRPQTEAAVPTINHLLMAFRIALTGAQLLETGTLTMDLLTLARGRGLEPQITALVQQNRDVAHAVAEPGGGWSKLWTRIQALLEESLDASELPEEPRGTKLAEMYLLDLRRRAFDAEEPRTDPAV